MPVSIPRCYDSHVHFLATGLYDSSSSLHGLTDPKKLHLSQFQGLQVRGEWLTNFGWDQHLFPDKKIPHRNDLDRVSQDRPIFLSRADGHACWVNQKTLEIAGLWKQKSEWSSEDSALAEFDSDGWPSGILYESLMYAVYARIPSLTRDQKKFAYLRAQEIFKSAGFSHIRDMECNSNHFETLMAIQDAGDLKLYVEENFNLENLEDLDKVVSSAVQARREANGRIRVIGIKFYLDGALGSQGAWVSEAYSGTESHGFCLWPAEAVEEILIKSWSEGLSVAVHALGDRASHFMMEIATRVKKQRNLTGAIHLEHAEILRDPTIELMRSLNVRCHIQPCHWLTDRRWLKDKQPKNWRQSFPSARLIAAGVPISFGSDSPIEKPSIAANLEALHDLTKEGIPQPLDNWWKYCSHPDTSWGAGEITKLP